MILVWSRLRQIGYRNKAREEASRGGSLAHRPDIDLATEVSKLTSQVHLKGLLKQWARIPTGFLQLQMFFPTRFNQRRISQINNQLFITAVQLPELMFAD